MNPVATHTDTQLIAAAREGDELAFRELVHRYEGKVAAVATGMLGRGPEAEDVGQETFIRFYRALGDFREDAATGTYLTRIAINLSLNALRRRKKSRDRETGLESALRLEGPESGDAAQERREARELVRRALGMMEPKFSAVILLRLIEGYSTKETAHILEVPVGTVLSRLKRAQEKLKKILKTMI